MRFDARSQFRTVAEDLEHLRDDWLQNPKNDVVRRGSVILRRLLAEGVLQRAWKEFGFPKEPTIVAPRLEPLIKKYRGDLRVVSAGGATDAGITVSGLVVTRQAPIDPRDGALTTDHPFRLSEFIESASVVLHDEVLKRREA